MGVEPEPRSGSTVSPQSVEIEKRADAYVVHHNTKQLKFTPGSTGFSD
jgi:hypothetical protein